VRAPGLALAVAEGGTPLLEAGWFAPEYGVKVPAPVVGVAVEGVARAAFTTLVAPLAPGEPAPLLAVRREGDAVVAEVTAPGRHDVLAWGDAVRPLDLGPVRVRARVAWLRSDAAGEPLALRACRDERWLAWDRKGNVQRGRCAP
jgi:hypothetical protein